MIRALWLLAFLSVAAGVSAGDADTRWKLRVHVFYDAGLKIEEFDKTYGTKKACDLAGGLKEISFARRNIMSPFECLPIHSVSESVGRIT